MSKTRNYSLFSRRFLPIFATQFLGAFNDNLFKNALVILITYVLAERVGMASQVLVTVAAGIFILPFFLFSSLAGQCADKYEKSALIRRIKLMEVLLMAIAGYAFMQELLWMLLVLLFLMGVQSTFFGPLKYSILPQHLQRQQLILANAWVNAGTFLAILLGTIAGGLLILADFRLPSPMASMASNETAGVVIVSFLVFTMAVLGWLSSRFIPRAGAADAGIRIDWNIPVATWRMVAAAREQQDVFHAILCISWFWLVGATFLAQFPNYAKITLHADETVVTFFLTLFSIGVGVGALLCNRLLKGRISGMFSPAGAVGMAVCIGILYLFSPQHQDTVHTDLINLMEFLDIAAYWPLSFALFGVALCGGVYVVPLYAITQSQAAPEHRARIIAANNIMNALFMVVSAGVCAALLAHGWHVTELFLLTGFATLPVAWFARRIA